MQQARNHTEDHHALEDTAPWPTAHTTAGPRGPPHKESGTGSGVSRGSQGPRYLAACSLGVRVLMCVTWVTSKGSLTNSLLSDGNVPDGAVIHLFTCRSPTLHSALLHLQETRVPAVEAHALLNPRMTGCPRECKHHL